jgi:hypothetical protein
MAASAPAAGAPPTGAFLFSTLLAEVAAQASRLALLARADELGGSVSATAGVLFAEAFLALLVGIFGGPLLDRYDPRWASLGANVWRGLAAVCFILSDSFAGLVALVALFALGDGLYVPARTALAARLAGEGGLLALNAKVGAAQGAALVLGPGLFAAGALLGGTSALFLVLAAFFLGAAAFLVAAPSGVAAASSRYFDELKEGLSFVSKQEPIRVGLALFGLAVFLVGGFYPLLPAFAAQFSPGQGEAGLAGLVAGLGVGGIIGALIAPPILSRAGLGRVALLTVGLDGLCFAGFSLPLGSLGAALWAGVWGVVILVSLIAFTTLFQEQSPEKLRGRVLALLPPLQGAGTALSFALVALLGRSFTAFEIARFGGLGLVALTLVLLVLPLGRRFSAC